VSKEWEIWLCATADQETPSFHSFREGMKTCERGRPTPGFFVYIMSTIVILDGLSDCRCGLRSTSGKIEVEGWTSGGGREIGCE